ncbi:MAG: hypothetical protein IPL60_12875 [Ardenticatenia bacterium]|nr:hypothetical protein [Ardenticatenia bacterium]
MLSAVLVVGLGSAVVRDAPVPPSAFATYRTAFDPGPAGWAQFEALAASSQTAAGRTFEVLAMLVDVRAAEPGVYFIPSGADEAGRRSIHYDFSHAMLRRSTRAWTRLSFDAFTYGVDVPAQLAPILTWYPDRTVRVDAIHAAAEPRSSSAAPPLPSASEPISAPIALRFAPNARLTPADIALAHRLLLARMPMLLDHPAGGPAPLARLVYFPNGFAQAEAARTMSPTLRQAGVPWASSEALNAGQRLQALNPGVAFGRLRVVGADDVVAMGADDEGIGSGDIIILDDLPLDLPIVAGTITQRLQTTLAHVNVLARARGTPNMALLDATSDRRIAPYVGALVRLEVSPTDFSIRAATAEEARAFAAGRRPAPLGLPPANLSVTAVRNLADLGFADASSVGTKAANLAELHRLMPDLAPGGLAVPFSAYDAHLASIRVVVASCDDWQGRCARSMPSETCEVAATVCKGILSEAVVPEDVGLPMSAYIDRLLDDPTFATDGAVRAAALHGLRTAIQRAPVASAFGATLVDMARAQFGDHAFRLRSSTNAEDLPGFSGAGLYDSVTATVDPDDDYAPDRIRKVWASAWSFRAFEERDWWGVPHRRVHMGVLVSRAYPDEDANGVLVTTNMAEPGGTGFTVNVQPGELSVTNATGGAFPEVLVLHRRPFLGSWRIDRLQASSASIDRPVLRPQEVTVLADAARLAQRHFAALYGIPTDTAAFEIEFKLDGRGPGVILKQIRPFVSP